MYNVQLNEPDVEAIEALIMKLLERYKSADDVEFVKQSTVYAQQLPERLRAGLNEFRLREPAGACRVSGFRVDDHRIGDTPLHWAHAASSPNTTAREEFFFSLCAALLGDIFGWASQQGGRLVHEVVPISGHDDLQINSASNATLLWHTEDAFHPYRADYVGLMCLRNPDRTETTFASMQDVHLDEWAAELLFQPRFVLKPDESHLPQNHDSRLIADADHAIVVARGYARIEQMLANPPKVSVLFGDPSAPYLRLDSAEVDRELNDPDAMAALDKLIAEVDKALCGIVLEPGNLLFVDNYRAVHGRKRFAAKFDGRDRWLKRMNVTRDLRRSRDARISPDARIVY